MSIIWNTQNSSGLFFFPFQTGVFDKEKLLASTEHIHLCEDYSITINQETPILQVWRKKSILFIGLK